MKQNEITYRKCITVSILFSLLFFPMIATGGEIRIGLSAALTGAASAIGISVKEGIELCFQQINEKGGIHGNTLRLIAYDDAYEAEKCGENMHRLIDGDNVLAVIGNPGAPNAVVSAPIAVEKKTLLFGLQTGTDVLRKSPPERYIINFRASCADEAAQMIAGLTGMGIAPEEIAFFTQNDAFGDAGFKGAVKALGSMGFTGTEKMVHGRYTRNTVNVEDALAVILAAGPKAVIMAGTYEPCAAFIRMAGEFLKNTPYVCFSSVGSMALAEKLGTAGEGVLVTQVVPPPDSDLPLVKAYRETVLQNKKTVDFGSLEGYIVSRILAEGLDIAGPEPTRESIIEALEKLEEKDMGLGFPLSVNSARHQISQKIWLTVIRNGQYSVTDWENLKKQL